MPSPAVRQLVLPLGGNSLISPLCVSGKSISFMDGPVQGGSSSGNSKSPEPVSLNAYSLGSTVVEERTYVNECATTMSGVRANDTIGATIYTSQKPSTSLPLNPVVGN